MKSKCSIDHAGWNQSKSTSCRSEDSNAVTAGEETHPNRSRRRFLKTAAAATGFALTAQFTIAGTKASGRVLGANERIRVGVAGINGRGQAHIDEFGGLSDVDITYLIDPDKSLHASRSKLVEEKNNNTPKTVQDIRAALEDDNLDAISIATCNHWHSLMTIWACQAGKDVYVEKPMSHNVFEGRQCVNAAKKYGRIVQHGTQNRSSNGVAREMAAIHSGKYGKLLVSKGYCCKPRWSIGNKPTTQPPADLDWNLWLGPADQQEFHGNMHPYNWHWFWNTGNGDTGNQGVHQIDIARWAIKDATLPNRVWSMGGRYIPGGDDQGETPNMQLTVFEYGDTLLLFETRGLVGKSNVPANVSNEFYTTDGVIRGGKFYPKSGGDPVAVEPDEDVKVAPGGAFGSFINAVRSRKQEDLNADVETAHYSSALCHLANISFLAGQPGSFDGRPSDLGDQSQVVSAYEAVVSNLKAVGVDLETAKVQIGKPLDFDPKQERFINAPEADRLLTRAYRGPFVVNKIA